MTRMSDGNRGRSSPHSDGMTGTRQRRQPPGVRQPEITSGNPLQLLIAQRLRDLGDGVPLSYRTVVERGKDRRGRKRFSIATVGNIINGKTAKLTDPTIEGLAQALELDAEQVRDAARQASKVKLTLPARSQQLSPDQWDELTRYMDYLLARGKGRR